MNKVKTVTKVLIITSYDVLDDSCFFPTDQYQVWQCPSLAAGLNACYHRIPDCILIEWKLVEGKINLLKQFPYQIPSIALVENENIEIEGDYLVRANLTKELLNYAIQNAIAQTQLKQQLESAIGLNILNQAIHSTRDLSTIFSAATTAIAKLLRLEYVEISKYKSESQTWLPSDYSSYLLSNNLTSSQLLQGEIISINSIVEADSNINCICLNDYEGSCLLVPLVVDIEVIGVIYIKGTGKNYWQNQEIDLVNNIATQLGIAIQQSRAYSQIQSELAERRRVEINLHQSEQLYATLAETSPVGIFRTDEAGNCLYVNERWCQISGLNAIQAMGMGWIEGIYVDDRPLVFSEWHNAVLNNRPFSIEYRFENPKGEMIWVYGQAQSELGIRGNIVGYVGTITDISDRKLAELALQELNESLEIRVKERTQELLERELQLRDLFDNSTDLIQIISPNGQILFVNETWKKTLGYENIDCLNIFEIIHPDSLEHCQSMIQSLLQGYQCMEIEAKFLTKAGKTIIVEGNVNCRFEDGKPISTRGIFRDVTERKQVGAQLLASQKELEQFFALGLGLLCIADMDGHFLRLNQAWELTLGYTIAELEGQDFLQFVHPDDISGTLEVMAKLRSHEEVIRFVNRYLCKDQTYRYLEWYCLPFGDRVYASAHDITIQKEINDLLRISEQNLRTAQRIASVGSWDFDLVTQKISWSQELFDNHGLDSTQLEPTYAALLQIIHPEDSEKFNGMVEQAALTGTGYEIEYRVITTDGSVKWILGRTEVALDDHGKAIRLFGTALDTTTLKEAAIAIAEAKEAAEAGTRAKSEFLASMSHEIRTPMNGVLGMVELLSGTDLTSDQQEYLQTIRDSGDALLTIINDILDLSKIEAGMIEIEERVFALVDILKSVSNLLGKAAADKEIMLSVIVHPSTPTTFLGDSSRLRQILLNLVSNAIKFTKKGSVTVTINSRLFPNDLNTLDVKCELFVKVSDTGIGIRSDRLGKLFQPFTQADAAISRKYGGTGLGLVICKRLVELMGGSIWVESFSRVAGNPPQDWQCDPNQTIGSSFYFTVAVRVDSTFSDFKSASTPKKAIASPLQSNLRILIAEDNLVNQKVMVRILQRLGYDTDIANNGIEVLEALTKQKYDLIFMDMQMPEMDGIEATQCICALYEPDSRPHIIAMTANAMQSDRDACLKAGMNDYMSKPIRVEDLETVIKNVEVAKILRSPQD